MVRIYTQAKWHGGSGRFVLPKGPSVSGIPDVKWNISNAESCETLIALGAEAFGFVTGPCSRANGATHCFHKFPGKVLAHCCSCECTFADNTTLLEEEGLI